MPNLKPHRCLSSVYEESKEIDEVSDVHLNKNRDQEELHFRNLKDLFYYLDDLDEDTWHRMKPVLKTKTHHLKGHSESKPGKTLIWRIKEVLITDWSNPKEGGHKTGRQSRKAAESSAIAPECEGEKEKQGWALSQKERPATQMQSQKDEGDETIFVEDVDWTTSDVALCTKKVAVRCSTVSLAVLSLTFFVLFLVYLNKESSGGEVPLPCHSPPCPPHWFWYQGMCYYFSEGEENWTSSKDYCFSHDASLARITKEEMDFIHLLKGKDAFWIGLRRSPGQPWTWLNGDIAMLEVLGDGGDCAYLDNDFRVISARCRTTFRWMCSKPDVLKQPK